MAYFTIESAVKRWWTVVTVVPMKGRFEIALDGEVLRLPGGGALRVDSVKLAEAIAEEWVSASDKWSPADVSHTWLAGTAQIIIAQDPAPPGCDRKVWAD